MKRKTYGSIKIFMETHKILKQIQQAKGLSQMFVVKVAVERYVEDCKKKKRGWV